MNVSLARSVSHDLLSLINLAAKESAGQRGGSILLSRIVGERTLEELAHEVVAFGELFVAHDASTVVGFALCRQDVIETIYVESSWRRQGVGRSLLESVVASHERILDAYALPGDRATKSLYESFGWKARLLTMRAE